MSNKPKRMNQYTKYKSPDKKELRELYRSGMTQSEIGSHYGVSQKVVFRWMKELGIETRSRGRRKQST